MNPKIGRPPLIERKAIRRRLAIELDRRGVTRSEIAERLAISRSYLYRVMRGYWSVSK
jgi:transcriptional regulator with XRE-family HTH domain